MRYMPKALRALPGPWGTTPVCVITPNTDMDPGADSSPKAAHSKSFYLEL